MRIRIVLLITILFLSACAQPPAYTVPKRQVADPVDTAFIDRKKSDLEYVQWARDEIRSGSIRPLTVLAAQRALKQAARDPDSVRFRGVVAHPETGAVCGFFNAKNAFGGYIGEEPFFYFWHRDLKRPNLVVGLENYVINGEMSRGFCPNLVD